MKNTRQYKIKGRKMLQANQLINFYGILNESK